MIQPDRILSELSDLWVSLGREHDGAASDGVLRACAMTLVVLADAAEDEAAVGETLAALMKDHPSRAIVVRISEAPDAVLASRVFAQCWMPFGRRQQICCEQIEITAAAAEVASVPAVVMPLAVADLPVILWERRAVAPEAEAAFASIATKTIVDTTAGSPLDSLAARVAAGQWLADLTWTRITRWRELIAQVFANSVYRGQMQSINRIEIEYAGAVVPPSARYIAAWLQSCLEEAGAVTSVIYTPSTCSATGNLVRVELSAPEGLNVSLARVDGASVEVRVNHLVRRTVFPKLGDYEQLRDELSVSTRDPIFERILARAAAQK